MNLQGYTFKGTRLSTHKEGEILYELIKKHKCKNIIEIGTNAGFNTVYLAYAAFEIGGRICTFDYDKKLIPTVFDNLRDNRLNNVEVIFSESILISLEENNETIENADFILIDECLGKEHIFELWNKLKRYVNKKCIIVLHDAQCELTEAMYAKELFHKWSEDYGNDVTLLSTTDDNGQFNGFAILEYRPDKEKLDQIQIVKEEIVEITQPEEDKIERKRRTRKEKEVKVEEKVLDTIETEVKEETTIKESVIETKDDSE